MIGLEPGGPIGDQRIGRRMALVEAVIGEFGEQVENLVGLALAEAALDRAVDETVALRVHLRLDLLAHRAAQQIGLAERIARQDLRDLHHLFLIDDDAERLAQHRLELGMDVVGLFLAELARAIGRDIGHRARPVERDQRDNVLETVGAHFDERLAHAAAFHLEHADRLAAPEHFVSLGIVERNFRQIDVDAAPRQQARRLLQAWSASSGRENRI